METLLSGMLSKMGDSGIEKISQSAGINPSLAKTILAQAGPLIAGKLADNAKKPEGLASLDAALQDHDGSVFDHIDDVANPEVDTKGEKILGHIFGGKIGDVVGALAGKNNTESSSTAKLLEMAAPLILGQLGSQKKSQGLDAGSIFDILQGEKKSTQDSGDSMLMDLAEQFLDKNGDGNIVDDLMGMAGNLFKK
jgi:hypothetical protein